MKKPTHLMYCSESIAVTRELIFSAIGAYCDELLVKNQFDNESIKPLDAIQGPAIDQPVSLLNEVIKEGHDHKYAAILMPVLDCPELADFFLYTELPDTIIFR